MIERTIRKTRQETKMIKPRRIGHATYETPDLQKMIDYYTQVMGLVLAEREKDRAFLVTQIGQLLTFKDNKGTTIALFKEWSYLGKHLLHLGIGPLKLGHIAWVVDDPQKTAEFYEKVLGFK